MAQAKGVVAKSIEAILVAFQVVPPQVLASKVVAHESIDSSESEFPIISSLQGGAHVGQINRP